MYRRRACTPSVDALPALALPSIMIAPAIVVATAPQPDPDGVPVAPGGEPGDQHHLPGPGNPSPIYSTFGPSRIELEMGIIVD